MPAPLRDGVGASSLTLAPPAGATLLQALAARFPEIAAAQWASRFERGLVVDEQGLPLRGDAPALPGQRLHYWRELPPEPEIPFPATLLHRDEHLLVVDKPHFLPVSPAGRFVQQSLLVRLRQQTGIEDLAPLHRLDRATAGVMLFSLNPNSRAAYHALFSQRRITKHYEALAPALPGVEFPLVRRSRIVEGEPFFRMCEVDGAPNSETRIELLEARGALALYGLQPLSGRKHQLRVHLCALGAPICNDPLYPHLQPEPDEDDYQRPLKLLARALSFTDPVSGQARNFRSQREL